MYHARTSTYYDTISQQSLQSVYGILDYESRLWDVGEESKRTTGYGIAPRYETLLNSNDIDNHVLLNTLLDIWRPEHFVGRYSHWSSE